MQKRHLAVLLLSLCVSAAAPVGRAPVAPPANAVTGDYVEARTASVFAGACHYNGELVTTGHDAVLAWHISHGNWGGVDLSGVSAMASIHSDGNLGDAGGTRVTSLIVDAKATAAQATAFEQMLVQSDGEQLGQIQSLATRSIHFYKQSRAYAVTGEGFAQLAVQPMPNDECCAQPGLVWYTPLMPISHRKVGYTQLAVDNAPGGDQWERSDENSAFYGPFTVTGR